MKIYLFDPKSGIYLGEVITDEETMKQDGHVMPPDATMLAPPEVERDQI